MIDATMLNAMNFVACSFVGWACICRLNQLNKTCDWRARARFVLMLVGAMASGFDYLFFGTPASIGGTVLAMTIAAGLLMSGYRWRRGPPSDMCAPKGRP